MLPDISNGRVTWNGLTTDSVATYTCSNGFQLIGEATRICQDNGQWNGAPPTCMGLPFFAILLIKLMFRETFCFHIFVPKLTRFALH